MPIHFNVSHVAGEAAGSGVRRQTLLNDARVPGIKFRLDRLSLDPGAAFEMELPANDLAWFQMLEGEVMLRRPEGDERLTDAHVVFLPPEFRGRLSTRAGASLLLAVVPNAAALDPEFATNPPEYRAVDWQSEPVLGSKHDERKRIYLVTPKLFGTKAIKGEMIIYPRRTVAPNHHHEGAAHFMYFLKGGGTAYASEQPFPVRKGDVVYYHDKERHYLRGSEDGEMVFSEFFVPGVFKTVWVEENKACTWLPTGQNIRGGKASREITAHSLAHSAAPTDV